MSADTGSQTSYAENADKDITRQRRLNAIYDARKSFVDRRRHVDDALHYHRSIDEFTANTVLRRELENYIHEVEWLMDETDTARDYWSGVDLGVMVLPDGSTIQFTGLQSIIETADPIHYSWTTEEHDNWDGRTEQDHEETVQIPRDVLVNGYRAVNGFLMEADLDLLLDDGEEEFGFDYSHLAPGVEDGENE